MSFELDRTSPDRPVIVSNSAYCNGCDDHIYSSHRHDMQWCKCGNIAVDGGQDYFRRAFADKATYVDTSITMNTGCIVECGDIVETWVDSNKSHESLVRIVLGIMLKHDYLIDSPNGVGALVLTHLDTLTKSVTDAVNAKRNNWGIVFSIARAMRDTGILQQKTE